MPITQTFTPGCNWNAFCVQTLQQAIWEAEAQQTEVEISPRIAEAILNALEEAGYEGFEYFG